jgi:CRISPR/Cas system-associated exonuclease Cas4 (RecB family)
MRLSKSAVLTYEQCPYNYKLDYILDFRHQRPEPEEGSPLKKGTEIHEIFENYYKLPEAKIIKEPYEENIFDLLMSMKNAHKYENHMENFAAFNVAQIEGHEGKGLKIMPKGIFGYIPQTEMRVFNEELNCLGYIDRVDMEENGMRVIDYKSSKRDKPAKHYLFELALYAYMYEQETGQKVYDAGIFFSNTGKLRTLVIEEQDKLGAIKKLQDTRKAIELKIFPKNPDFLCGWCDNRGMCGPDLL